MKKVVIVLLLVLLLAISSAIFLRSIRFSKDLPSVEFLDVSRRTLLEGIEKTSDINRGDQNTIFSIVGKTTSDPKLVGENWIVSVRANNKIYTVDLGKGDYKLGANVAKNGILSNSFQEMTVTDAVSNIPRNTPVIIYVMTGYSGKPTENPNCNQQCLEFLNTIDAHGYATQLFLEDYTQNKNDDLIIRPITQITFDNG